MVVVSPACWQAGWVSEVLRVDSPGGPGELVLDEAPQQRASLLLGHGAGGGIDSWDLALLAQELPRLGVGVARYRQPWLVAGRRVAGAPASLDRAWATAIEAVTARWPGKLFVGGRSAGARCACRCFTTEQAGVVALSFPLHPPGRPEKTRLHELAAVAPALILQGQQDPFGGPDELAAALLAAGVEHRIVAIPSASHSMTPPARFSAEELESRRQLILGAVQAFVTA